MGFGRQEEYIQYSEPLNLESFAFKDSNRVKGGREGIDRGTLGAKAYPLLLVAI